MGKINYDVGDLVQLNKNWDNRIGFIKAKKAWYLIENRWDIAGCICNPIDIKRIIKKKIIPKKYIRFIQ